MVSRPLIEPTREQIMHLHCIGLVTLSPRDILTTRLISRGSHVTDRPC